MKSEYRIGRVWGIPINVHFSLLLLMGYLVLQGAYNGAAENGLLGSLISIVFVLIGVIVVFFSIALHELGHSFVALHKGCRVREITLMFMGGAAQMEELPRRPRDELLMAIAGPAVSALLGVAFYSLGKFLDPAPSASHSLISIIASLMLWVGVINVGLTIFNLLPAFPMDGGRVFRAMLSPRFGRLQATRIAATVGKVIAVIMAFVGIFGIPGTSLFNGGSIGLIAVAGFVTLYGEREFRQVQVEELMRKRGFGTSEPPPEGDAAAQAAADEPPLPDENTVLISPPPYIKGPAQRAEVTRTRHRLEDVFNDPFRR